MKNSMLSFLKEKSFLIVLTLTLVAAGTMAALFAFGGKNEPQGNQLAQQEEAAEKIPTVTDEPYDGAEPAKDGGSQTGENKVSDIALLEELQEEALPEMNQSAELEDQFVEAQQLEEASAGDILAEEFDEAADMTFQWPVQGEVIMEFAMDHSVYFETLAQYQYNPAMMIAAEEGTKVLCAAAGTVIESAYSNEIGNYVKMDLGNGFMLTYGQLADVTREVGEAVDAGESIGVIAKPSRSYTEEGSNLYLHLTKDDVAVDPAQYLE